MLKGILLQIMQRILLLLVSRRWMYIDVGVIIINNDDSAIGSIELDILQLVPRLRPLVIWLAVLLRLYHHLIGEVASVIYVVRGRSRFRLF
jgi:hypothetical protein